MTVGKPPPAGVGYALQDGKWLLGLAGGANHSVQGSITAHAGGTKAAAFQLPANVAHIEVDTVANSGDSVLLPSAQAGMWLFVFNNGANTLDLYGQGTDTINGATTATAYTLAATNNAGCCGVFFCAVKGKWGAIKSA